MTRVLHVIDSLATGGSEKQLTAMLAQSNRRRFQHTVCALGKGDPNGAVLQAAGIPVYALNRVPRREIVRTLVALLAVIREVAPDVVHTSLYWSDVLGRTAARLSGRPVVTTLVNTTYEPEWRRDNPRLTSVKVALARTLDRVTARWWGTSFVALTQAVRLSATRHLGIPPERITVIPRGLQSDQDAPPAEQVAALRAQLGWAGAYPVVVSVGRLVPQKGHRYAIQAMGRIAEAFPRALLVLVGDGALRGELEHLARWVGQADRVRFLGERRDVPALLAAADLFVFPSLFEGFGGALVEALSAGRACVASRIASIREVTDGGRVALLVDPQSPEALAEGVIRLARDRALAAHLSQEAAAWVREQYSMNTSILMLEEVFDAVTSGWPVHNGDARIGLQ